MTVTGARITHRPDVTYPHTGAFDLAGWSTLALAFATAVLACVAFWQAQISRRAMRESKLETERDFAFDALRQTQALTPIVVAEASPLKPTYFRFLVLRNVGQGPAINVRFSGALAGNEFSAAQYSVAAIAAAGNTQTNLQLHKDYGGRWPIHELFIRYEDIFGNTYSTEYQNFAESSEWYLWRRPWLGRDLGLPRPELCSLDEPSFGLKGRVYYDATKGLY